MDEIFTESDSISFLDRFKLLNSSLFCYGFGRQQPYSTFLFEIDFQEDFPLFSSNWNVSYDEIPLNPYIIQKIENLSPKKPSDHFNASSTILFSIAESLIKRINLKNWQCTICNSHFLKEDIIQHIIEQHSPELIEIYKNNISIMDDDNDKLNNLLLKLQYDAAISPQYGNHLFTSKQQISTVAPIFYENKIDFIEEEEEEEYNSPDSSSDFSFRKNIDYPNEPPLSPELVSFLTDRYNNHKKIISFDTSFLSDDYSDLNRAESLFSTVFDSISSPIKQESNNLSLDQISFIENSKINDENIININQLQKDQEIRELSKQALMDLSNEEFMPSRNNSSKKSKKKIIKKVSFIETLPFHLKDQIIHSVADQLIKNFIKSTINGISDKTIQEKKKEQKLEKAQKIKEEERLKALAFKQRRMDTIQLLTKNISNSLIRSFIHSEINLIFNEEKKTLCKSINIPNQGKNLPALVINSNFLYDQYFLKQVLNHFILNFNFVLDDDGSPKIRFRYNFDSFEALLYLSSLDDLKKLIDQSPIYIDSRQIHLSLNNLDQNYGEIVKIYTNQEIHLQNKNNNSINNLFNRDKNNLGFEDLFILNKGLILDINSFQKKQKKLIK